MANSSDPGAHILVFPFPEPGHIIPLLDLTHQLLTRGLTVTVIVPPKRLSLLEPLLSTHSLSSLQALVLSPPDVPLNNNSVIGPLDAMFALGQLHDPILNWFKSHPSPPVAITSDMFLGWTHHLANELGVPRVVFWPSGAFSAASFDYLWRNLPMPDIDSDDDENTIFSLVKVPGCPKFPWWQIAELYRYYKKGDPIWEFCRENWLANTDSWGYVFNSFAELEGVYLDHLKKERDNDRVWAVGPLTGSLKRGGSNSSAQTHEFMDWLDSKKDDEPVVYVCFGTQWSLTDKQVHVLATALELSRLHFIWVLKEADIKNMSSEGGSMFISDFEERIKGRGILIKGWASQVMILRHRAVKAFVTHCGWNSMVEGLSAGVLLLTWPLGGDQFNDARLLVDELGLAVRLCDDGTRVAPDPEQLARLLVESINNLSVQVKDKIEGMLDAAAKACEGGGSSAKDFDILVFVKQLCNLGNGDTSPLR